MSMNEGRAARGRRWPSGLGFGWLRRLRESPRRRLVPAAYYLVAREGFASDQELASALDVSPDELLRWKEGEGIAPEGERRLRDLAVAVSELLTVYEPSVVSRWLRSRSRDEIKTPLEWLREGNLAEVLQLINAASTGAYS
jgi:hypothetical protein